LLDWIFGAGRAVAADNISQGRATADKISFKPPSEKDEGTTAKCGKRLPASDFAKFACGDIVTMVDR
jgi:hypothetical protein